jgi:hypothetical protein
MTLDTKNDVTWESFLYKEDWGERMAGRTQTVLVVLQDLHTPSPSIHVLEPELSGLMGIPNTEWTLSQPVFGVGETVVFRCLDAWPRKYGIVYCHNRPYVILILFI